MRQIILDTETTGLEPALGHRIVEIAGIELVNRRLTGNNFHRYVNPERDSEDGALQVHGLTREFLSDKPRFQDIADAFLDYVSGAQLIIHNAPFDIAFLNNELNLVDRRPVAEVCPDIIDTLRMARELHPGKKNNLDALCERYQVDNSARTLHDALLDAKLLAEVYLAMTRGQESLMMDVQEAARPEQDPASGMYEPLELVVLRADAAELSAHEKVLADIDTASRGACVWKRLETTGERRETRDGRLETGDL